MALEGLEIKKQLTAPNSLIYLTIQGLKSLFCSSNNLICSSA
jgi:hypothetical protein